MDSMVKDRMECPICGYSMKILEETETEYKGYCASCSTDVIVKKLNNAITPYKKAIERLREQNYDLLCSNAEISKENDELKSELRRIYDVATINKTREIVDSIYDELLYETSEESEHKRNIILKCLEKLDDFRDDVE